ncbi:MAG TPA: FUSC family protein, partial [Microbacterium sp.]|nr:FUSC family protein [Microbacterium sp.]
MPSSPMPSIRAAAAPSRLLFAAKTAAAVGIAWIIAHYLPGFADDHPYYAPLGALISMHPTLMDSVKSSLQTLAGLAAGIVLALLVVFTVGPNVWTLALVAGIGVLLSGTGWFGAGREYIAVAAVFVLILGGDDPDAYSLSYLAQMAVGLVVGLVVNLLVPPGPFSATAEARVAEYQRDLSDHLAGIGDALEESWPPERAEWTTGADALDVTARDV